MFFGITRAGDVFMLKNDNFRAYHGGHVVVWRKSTSDATTYEVLRKWGHGRFFYSDSIAIAEAERYGGEVVCVCDRKCIQTFRLDGSFLHLFDAAENISKLITAFGHIYVVNHFLGKIVALALDGTLLFRIDVPDVCDMTVLGDELFVLVLVWPGRRRDLHVYSARDGTFLRSIIAVANPYTRIQASPEGSLWLLSTDDDTVQRMNPDFTLVDFRMTACAPDFRWGVVWDEGKAIGLTRERALVPLNLEP